MMKIKSSILRKLIFVQCNFYSHDERTRIQHYICRKTDVQFLEKVMAWHINYFLYSKANKILFTT